MFKYGNYIAKLEVNPDTGMLHGKVLNISATIAFEGTTVKEAEQKFREAVDAYVQSCQAQGDVLQFLKRNEEALANYNQALQLYRITGSRQGEANTLQAQGLLQDDLDQALNYCLNALKLYQQIGTKYSQSRNLIFFTSVVQLKRGERDAAINSLIQALDLARQLPYAPLIEAAETRLKELSDNNWLNRLKRWFFNR